MKELIKTIDYDIQMMSSHAYNGNMKDFEYHYKLARGNLRDLKRLLK